MGFLRKMAQQVGAFLAQRWTGGNQQAALQHFFWLKLLQAQMQGDTTAVHQVMRQNMGLIVPALGDTIAQWVQGVLAQHPDQAEPLAALVENTCTSIQQFPYGRYAEALEIAIRGYGVVLELRADQPAKRAQTLTNLGVARNIQAQMGINPTANLERAIAAYDEAAEIMRWLGLDKDLSATLTNLGNARSIQAEMGINPAANLERAIAALDEAAEIWRRLGLDKDLSTTLNNLGAARWTQAEMGINPTANLKRAIAALDEAAEIRRRLGLDKDLSQTLTNLGVARWTQAQMGINPTANLERAIAAYDEAAEIMRWLGLYKDLSQTLNNLGNARWTQAEMGINPTANLERAIAALDEAAEIMRRLGLDKDLSGTLNNLGNARQTQAEMGINPTANLERAIAAYDEAARIMRRLGLDKDLSSTLTNLGVARVTQAEMGINPAANLERAIAALDEAAEIRRRLELDKDLSDTLNNLGNARRIQAEMGINPAANLERAIAAYDQAAGIQRRLGLDKDLSQTLTNLGVARQTQARMGINPTANLERAIAALDEAAEIWRRLGLYKDLSDTLTGLGVARWTQAEMGINPAANLERAIAAYDQAAEIMRRLGLDKDLSATLTNLGAARQTQAEMGINPTANLERAIAVYDEAAEIMRRLGLARDLATTLSNFGFAYQAQSRLPENSANEKQTALENAYQSFQKALDRVEYLRGEIGADSEGYKRNFNEEWNRVYRGMVEVCLELGRYQDAIEYVDRSKARNLTELIATRDAYPGGVIPESTRQRLQELRTAIFQAERRLQDETHPDPTHLNQLREEKQQLEPYKPLHFQAMQGLLDKETAILEWYILKDKFLTFTLMPDPPLTPPSEGGEQEADSSEPPFLRGAGGIRLWTSSEEDLDNLIDWTNIYINDYRHLSSSQWREDLPERLETLAQILHLDEILQNLRQQFPNCQKLILIPHRFLHLFPLHALPVATEDDKGFLQDLFPKGVGYAPNCQVLQQAKNRQRPDFNRLFAIQNPTQDLQFTDMEVEAIQSLFDPHEVLEHDKAEKAAILDGDKLKNAHCIHFSCHGYFNFEDALKSALILAKSSFTPPPPTDDPSRYLPLEDNKLLDLQKCLTLEDILRLDLTNCRLVTLSACETGITDFTSTSDEYIGLPSGFILAGSPNVVSTLWAVNDLSTAIFMIHFYQTLRQQPELSVVLALRQTQTWLRSATVQDLLNWVDSCAVISPERREEMKFTLQWGNEPESQPFSSPYYWAAFCAIGQTN
jgi:CHAT domain-containing protein